MKLQSTTMSVSKQSLAARAAYIACAVLVTVSMPIQLSKTVFADQYDDQIKSAQNEANENNSQANELAMMASTYQEELRQLESQSRLIQEQITKSQSRYNQLSKDIKTSQNKIDESKDALGDVIVEYSITQSITPLEMVASKGNIADVVDSISQQSAMQKKLTETVDEINRLKKKLEGQQKAVQRELETQKAQRAQLAAKESEKQKLIEDTKGEENAYRERANANNLRVEQLRAAQAEANARAAQAAMRSNGGSSQVSIPAGEPGGGGYPGAWASAPLDAYVDPWGLYTRECVSYVAWKIHSTGRYVPHFGGAGNANQWPSTVARYGISSGSTPKAGAAAVMNIGYYGHVMYVESVNGDGTITVSDYNFAWDGLYRKYTRSAAGLTYVYF